MYINERITKIKRLVQVLPLKKDDFKKLTVKRYIFNWKNFNNGYTIYKLTFKGSEDILGLMALVDYPAEERTEIRLLSLSIENIGENKQYERIAGCLIAFAGSEAMRKFKNYPALSLIPKTELKQHYIDKYGMIDAGRQLYLEDISLLRLIKEYL